MTVSKSKTLTYTITHVAFNSMRISSEGTIKFNYDWLLAGGVKVGATQSVSQATATFTAAVAGTQAAADALAALVELLPTNGELHCNLSRTSPVIEQVTLHGRVTVTDDDLPEGITRQDLIDGFTAFVAFLPEA